MEEQARYNIFTLRCVNAMLANLSKSLWNLGFSILPKICLWLFIPQDHYTYLKFTESKKKAKWKSKTNIEELLLFNTAGPVSILFLP